MDKGEFFALYQPQLSVDGLRVVSAEALLRWSRPGIGTIGPDDFVPFAEDNKLIDELGSFMLERACETAAHWGDLPVSINVSPLQFARVDLAAYILTIAAKAGLPPGRLEIEITETAPIGDIAAVRATIAELRAQGVRVSLDDLGAGHATTCLMRELPLDRVKLGKSMADDAMTEKGAEHVSNLIQQARDFGLAVTAEGVETQAQLDFMRSCGCDRIQGYIFAKPMSGAEISAFARQFAG